MESASQNIWGSCAALWEHIVELESKYLRAYGAIPEEAAEHLDRAAAELLRRIERISDLVSQAGAGTAPEKAGNSPPG